MAPAPQCAVSPFRDACRLVYAAVRVAGRRARRAGADRPGERSATAAPPTKVQADVHRVGQPDRGGIRLVDDEARPCPLPTQPWTDAPSPGRCPNCRRGLRRHVAVVSSDGHPISGASSFGVGTAAGPPCPAPGRDAETADSDRVYRAVAGGYRPSGWLVAFALFAGVAAFVLLCAPGNSKDPTLQLLVRGGILGGAVAAVAAILVQGPYTAGVSMSQVLDMGLLQETLSTPFGTAMVWRLGLYVALGVLVWRLPRILTPLGGWLLPAGSSLPR